MPFLRAGISSAPGDLALSDQKLAVEWVLTYIKHFGGNAEDIVLMGSASGAWSVGAHLVGDDPFWRQQRFTKAILHSESPLARLQCPLQDAHAQLDCLRNASVGDLIRETESPDVVWGPTVVPKLQDAARLTGRTFFVGVVSDEASDLMHYLRSIIL
ncbi:hypothetical protein HPB48_008933 [Haemaphysalis longicornis]|uniref:Carboxylesterase type B domain-containing protein n=1 Tax=Haemaphysalis longicornis TaxID=44386 RepID=A0A9J6H436_HAELO|nr:hypothetical protein HPB48_008933 [Haemaphysalis longicornis]